MNLSKTAVLLSVMISGFVFAVSLATLYAQTHISEGTACSCVPPIPLLIPTFSSLGIFVGLMTYYLLSPVLKRRYWQFIDLILNALEPEEALVLRLMLSNGGEISQAELSRKLGKLRAFRVVERLKRRGIVEKESYGKTNKIRFGKKFQKLVKFSIEESYFPKIYEDIL